MNGEPPPSNRAIGWYRFMLWVMPTCVAIMSIYGFGWLAAEMGFRHFGLFWGIWWVFNIAAAIGVGIFQAKLESPRWRGRDGRLRASRVANFVMLQFVIVPVLSCVIAFGYCLVASV
jgi:hypothetical protein